ncbi:Thioredoxin Disulfide Isomerase [hydrothermal vent metagenome]|uniref:Thioredoxin Disulfide Isomerase n=1 Tax=hydrothermal vent metagenome TaxID=652676 RepID=A0A3B0TB81_9ZZZZ
MIKRLVLVIIGILTINGVFAQDWQKDIEKAKEIAANENKTIVLVFQGSDWCAPCIRLDREVWSTDTFKAYAKDNFVMLQADFPRKKKNALPEIQAVENAELAEKYNKKGIFPFVVVMDKDGNTLGETGYKKVSPEAYIKILNSIKD